MRPAHAIVLALALVPAWKVVEGLWPRSAKPVTAEAMAAGRELFEHEWTPNDPLTGGDGLGPVFNAKSCVDCHHQGGAGGGGGVDKNVTVYRLAGPNPRGPPPARVVHQKAVSREFQETLQLVHPSLPSQPSLPLSVVIDKTRPRNPEVVVTQRNTPALFGAGLIDAVSDEELLTHQREHSVPARLVGLNGAKDGKTRGHVARLADGRIGRFGWKGEFATLNDFVKAACANELGLSNPERPQATPLGKSGYKGKGVDLTDAQCILMTDFIRGLPTPTEDLPADPKSSKTVAAGRELFKSIGCADCHTPSLGPIAGFYSDLLLHDMGIELESSTGYYGAIPPPPTVSNDRFAINEQPPPGEWRTAPLWGVADSAPYLHDGRAKTLREAIEMHGGEAVDVTARFKERPAQDQEAVIAFLKTLRAPSSSGENSVASR